MSSYALPNIFPDIGPVTRAVLFQGLWDDQPPDSASAWEEELPILLAERLAGPALLLIRQYELRLPPALKRELEAQEFNETLLTASVVQASAPIVDALDEAGIPCLVVKGPGIAAELGKPSERSFSDLDILVPPGKFGEAFRLVSALGYSEATSTIPQRGYFRRYCREGTNLTSAAGGAIDLHHRISPWNWSKGLDFERLFEARTSATLYDAELPVPSPIHNALIVGLHIVSDKNHPGRTYRTWRDLVQLIQRCDDAELADAARAVHLASWLAWLCTCLPDGLGQDGLLTRLSPRHDLVHPRRLGMLLTSPASAEPVFLRFFRLPVPNAVANVLGSLWPSKEYLRHQDLDERFMRVRLVQQAIRRRSGSGGQAVSQPPGSDQPAK